MVVAETPTTRNVEKVRNRLNSLVRTVLNMSELGDVQERLQIASRLIEVKELLDGRKESSN